MPDHISPNRAVTVSISDSDYQFYFKEEPVCFIADNQGMGNNFSGSVYFNADNGTKGVITVREGNKVTGMKFLSEEETKKYNDRYW